jgi:prevent-host-death family protein
MDTVGIRELKAHLSRHLKRVRAGRRLLVTERGQAIASIHPIETATVTDWAHALVEKGLAHWAGGKPAGAARPGPTKAGRSVATAVLEDRR